ncbi:MAG: HORMA domain-containing protein [Podila humilis]|nr:MAG: HORMA domain-containing protein [Podila humilis]
MAQEHTTWNTEPLTRNQSLEAIKEAVLSVVGTVLYVRGIYPEEAYLDCPETGFICKRLVRGKDSHADCLLDSVEHGVFDALTKGYLRQIVVSVLLNLGGTAQRRIGSKIIETYKLTVSYQDGHPSLQLESLPKQSSGQGQSGRHAISVPTQHTGSGVQTSFSSMLACLIRHLQSFQEPVVDSQYDMRLVFWEDRTPLEYAPPDCFAYPSDHKWIYADPPAERLWMGKTMTGHHSLGLVTDSVEKTRQLGDFDDTAYSNIPVEFMEQQEEQWFPEHLEHVDRNWRSTSSESLNQLNLYNEETLALYDRLLLFMSDPTKDVMIFPENLNGRQRRILRLIANRLSLYHCNEGEGSLCRLVIKKTLLPAHLQKAPIIGSLLSLDGMNHGMFTETTEQEYVPSATRTNRHDSYSSSSASNRSKGSKGLSPSSTSTSVLPPIPEHTSYDPVQDLRQRRSNLPPEVDCVCGAFGIDKEMLRCFECKKWGHFVCYGYGSSHDPRLPEKPDCYSCLARMKGGAAVLENLFDPEAKPWAKFRFQRLVVRAAAVMWSEAGIHGNQLAIRFGLVSSSKAYKVLDTLIEEKYLEKGSWAFGKKQAPRILENEENGRRLAELIDPRHLVDFLRAAFDNVLETQGISQTADSSPAFSSNPSRHKVV